MYLQYHVLTGYGPSLLNRDATGEAKEITIGGMPRTRVSSQSLKYAWRNNGGGLNGIDAKRSIRSRHTYRREIADKLAGQGYPRPLADGITYVLRSIVGSGQAPPSTSKELKDLLNGKAEDDLLMTGQVVVLGEGEVDYLRSVAAEHLDTIVGEFSDVDWSEPGKDDVKKARSLLVGIADLDLRKNLHAIKLGAGLSGALFGRMRTSNNLQASDSAVQVSHAFTVHRREGARDYFTAIDEMLRDQSEEISFVAHIGESELTGGLFYMYVGVDVAQLVSNIEGVAKEEWERVESDLAAEVLQHVPRMIATISPGAKKGSTAPFSYARFVLAERSARQPRSLADAFLKPVPRNTEKGVAQEAISRVSEHVESMDRMYGGKWERRVSALTLPDGTAEKLGVSGPTSIDELGAWSAETVRAEAAAGGQS